LRLHGFEIPATAPGADGPGNEAWQIAQRMALEFNAKERRN
jgi:hypothetical protein